MLGIEVDVVADRFGIRRGGPRHRTQCEHRCDRDTNLDSQDQIERDGDRGRDDKHDSVATRRSQDGPHVVDVDHPHGGDHQHARQRGERDASDERAREEDDEHQHA